MQSWLGTLIARIKYLNPYCENSKDDERIYLSVYLKMVVNCFQGRLNINNWEGGRYLYIRVLHY